MPSVNPIKLRRAKLRQARVAKVSKLYTGGKPIVEIAAMLEVSTMTVWSDLRKAHEMWRSTVTKSRQQWIERELTTLDWLELEATRAWTKSIGKITTREIKAEGTDNETVTVREHRSPGDPRYLEAVRKCVEDRRKLLGLDAPATYADDHPGEILAQLVTEARERVRRAKEQRDTEDTVH